MRRTQKICKITNLDLSYVVTVKSTMEILQNFVAFSEYMNFTKCNSWVCFERKWGGISSSNMLTHSANVTSHFMSSIWVHLVPSILPARILQMMMMTDLPTKIGISKVFIPKVWCRCTVGWLLFAKLWTIKKLIKPLKVIYPWITKLVSKWL